MIRVLAVAAAIAAGATLVYAQSTAIGERQQLFKGLGKAAKVAGGMMKGEAPFDLAAVQASLDTISANAAKLKTLFPDDSKSGAETAALPKIWEKKDDFLPRFDKLAADAAAAKAAITDDASLKAQWPKIGANCGGCHKEYRKPD